MSGIETASSLRALNNADVLGRHMRWYRLHATLPVLWGAWLVLAQSYQSSATYSAAAALGTEWRVGLFVLMCGVMAHLVLWLLDSRRKALIFTSLLLALVFGAICGLFALGNWRSTGVPVNAFFTVGHLLAFREILRDTYEEVRHE